MLGLGLLGKDSGSGYDISYKQRIFSLWFFVVLKQQLRVDGKILERCSL